MNALTKIIHNLARKLHTAAEKGSPMQYLSSLHGARKLWRPKNRLAGIALIETLVAATLLGSICVTAFLGLSTGILATSKVNNGRTAMDIAQSQMESIKVQDFYSFIKWDTLDNKTDNSWEGYNTTDAKVTVDPSDCVEGTGSLQIEEDSQDNPGTQTATGLAEDWSDFDDGELLLWAKADDAQEVHVRIIDTEGDYEEFHSAALGAADTWQELDYDLSAADASSGTLDWDDVDQVRILIDRASPPAGYTFHIDDLRLVEPDQTEYSLLPSSELHGWNQSQIDIDVTPEDTDITGDDDWKYLQHITVTVTYGSGTRTVVLEGYKSSR